MTYGLYKLEVLIKTFDEGPDSEIDIGESISEWEGLRSSRYSSFTLWQMLKLLCTDQTYGLNVHTLNITLELFFLGGSTNNKSDARILASFLRLGPSVCSYTLILSIVVCKQGCLNQHFPSEIFEKVDLRRCGKTSDNR